MPTQESFMRLPDVIGRVGLSKSEIYRRIKANAFPKGHRRSHKVCIWYQSEVDDWVNKQIENDMEGLFG